MFKQLYVYILECSDGSYYVGITNDPERRLIEHNSRIKSDSYTYSRTPVRIVYVEAFSDFSLAYEWERRIKGWTRKKKEALIKENWDELKKFSECKNKTSHRRDRSLDPPFDCTQGGNPSEKS